MSPSPLLHLMRGDDAGQGSLLAEERYWAALVLDQAVSPAAIDPTLAATTQLVHAMDSPPQPDPAFVARLERELLGAAHGGPAPSVAGAVAGSLVPATAAAPAGLPTPIRRHVVMTVASMAALLAIVLASVVVTLRVGLLAPHARVEAPLVFGPGITGERLLLQARFDTFPDGILSAEVGRWVLQPGAAMAMGDRGAGSEGASAYLVESGTLTVQPEGPLAVTRAGTTTPVPVAAGSPIVLQPDDRGFAPTGVTSRWENTGAIPVRILEARIRRGDVSVKGEGVLNYSVIGESPFAKPDQPITMTVHQVTLQPGANLSANSVPGLEMLKVEAGRLVAVDVHGEGRSLPSAELGQATKALRSFPPGRVFRSGSDEPVTLLIVTIADANPLGTAG